MKPWLRKTALCLAIASITACSSSDPVSVLPADDDSTGEQTPSQTPTSETPTTQTPTTQTPTTQTPTTQTPTTQTPTTQTPTTQTPTTQTPTTQTPTTQTPTTQTPATETPTPTQPVDNEPTAPIDFGDLPDPTIPPVDLLAPPIPGPDISDPFGSLLEIDTEAATAGGAPTQPKNLRVDLISNNWAEFSWAPSNDDGDVVAYRIYRSDGHMYTVGRDQTDPSSGTQLEINKYWSTTSFIDCNYTRFLDRLHECGANGPRPGDIFSYEVTAVDDAGNESAASDAITINYHAATGAAVPLYSDPYLDESRFAQKHDLSNTAYFMDKFSLVFEDDFNGTDIDPARWNTSLLWGDETIINGEQQYFVDTQSDTAPSYQPFNLSDSILTIEAVPTPADIRATLPAACSEADPSGNDRCAFLSGALSSHDKFNMTYGYVEGRMKTSGTSGALSSFYLYHRYPGEGVNQHAPEIDIVEYLGENPFGDEDAFQTYHFADVNTGEIRSAPTMEHKNPTGELYSDAFHTYGVLWEPQLVIWYIDGVEIKRLSGPQVARQGMNIVTYLVAGSGWAPTPDINGNFPIQYQIDYIRAYQRDAYKTNGLYPQ